MSEQTIQVDIQVDSTFPESFFDLVEARLGAFPELVDLVERSLVGSFPLNYVDIGFVTAAGTQDLVLRIQPREGLTLLVSALSADQIDVNRVQEIFHDYLLGDVAGRPDYLMVGLAADRPDELQGRASA